MTPGSPSIEALEVEARYARERYQLYRAKAYAGRGPRAWRACASCKRIHEGAEARLRRARQADARKAGD